jgi:signal peptidase I
MNRIKYASGVVSVIVIIQIVFVLIALGFVLQYFFGSVQLRGDAGMPYLFADERVSITRDATYLRGDIVLMKIPEGAPAYRPGFRFVKRIVGVAGDRIRMIKGQVFLNDQLLDESYIVAYWKAINNFDSGSSLSNSDEWYFRPEPRVGDFVVPPDTVFVLGDNRSVGGSEDSRVFGPVALNLIEGRVTGVRWPIWSKRYEFKTRFGQKEWLWWIPVKRDYSGHEDPKTPSIMRNSTRSIERPEVFQRLDRIK